MASEDIPLDPTPEVLVKFTSADGTEYNLPPSEVSVFLESQIQLVHAEASLTVNRGCKVEKFNRNTYSMDSAINIAPAYMFTSTSPDFKKALSRAIFNRIIKCFDLCRAAIIKQLKSDDMPLNNLAESTKDIVK